MTREPPPIGWLSRAAWQAIVSEGTAKLPLETGGVLMGYWDPVGRDVVITAAIGPGPEACHEPAAFCPDHDHQVTEISRHYEASGRRSTYLGDWHTHPMGPGKLSRQDRRTLARIARTPEARAPHPLMLVAAGGDPWDLSLWCLTASRWWRLATEPLIIRLMPNRTSGRGGRNEGTQMP